jgi:hypothetical protein
VSTLRTSILGYLLKELGYKQDDIEDRTGKASSTPFECEDKISENRRYQEYLIKHSFNNGAVLLIVDDQLQRISRAQEDPRTPPQPRLRLINTNGAQGPPETHTGFSNPLKGVVDLPED